MNEWMNEWTQDTWFQLIDPKRHTKQGLTIESGEEILIKQNRYNHVRRYMPW